MHKKLSGFFVGVIGAVILQFIILFSFSSALADSSADAQFISANLFVLTTILSGLVFAYIFSD